MIFLNSFIGINISKQASMMAAALSLVVCMNSCQVDLPKEVADAYNGLPENINFNTHIKPILSDRCFSCHGPDKAKVKAGLRLDIAEMAYSKLKKSPGKKAISPGSAASSEVYHRIISESDAFRMPPPESNLVLSDYEKALIIKWIENGAEYEDQWAFTKPVKSNIPSIEDQEWAFNEIDNFVEAKLESLGKTHSGKTTKELLLRRVAFDLTGLPPTLTEIDDFVFDLSTDAYEKQVDRLLSSPHYGERLASDWMDVARYADTHGYLLDRYRDMSPWRDWVIKAFNENLSYDQFLTWQLAGDLLPNPTREQVIATGFNRLHPQTIEDGIIDEEYRVAYVSDRTDVMSTGILGLTLACAKCHNHKFDPFSQKEYYEMYSFFNQINESGQISWEGATPTPTLLIPKPEQEEILAYINKVVNDAETNLAEAAKTDLTSAEKWISEGWYKGLKKYNPPRNMIAYFPLSRNLINARNRRQRGKMDRKFSAKELPEFTRGYSGRGLKLNGDSWLDLGKIGIFKRSNPFSISLKVNIPQEVKEGVIFHKGMGTRIHSYRGYHLYLKDNRLQLMLAHTWPDNAIVEYTVEEVPKDEWITLTMTYDGSSKASGVKVYLNGKEMSTEVEIDNLYKDIVFNNMVDDIYEGKVEPGLQIGARWGGKGLKDALIDEIKVFNREITAIEAILVHSPQDLIAIISKNPSELSSSEKNLMTAHHISKYSKLYNAQLVKVNRARTRQVNTMEGVQEVMVMKEMDKTRPSYLLDKGLYNLPLEQVFPSTPAAIFPFPDDLPKNRLGLAKWVTDPDHPLTARVAVNRYWQMLFGTGIVKTSENFGNQGDLPSHPELLDWLAVDFMESGWDVKALLKKIVMSSTYQQVSEMDAASLEEDPDNRWLARGPALRLTAEMIRDNALATSGLLNTKIGGESVKPYQPRDLWEINNANYQRDKGDDIYRRSLYTFWKRSVPNPTQATFDMPDRNECTVRRQQANSPMQALALMNDPTFLEAAKVLGEKLYAYEDLDSGISSIFLQLTGRAPLREELNILKELHENETNLFKDRKKIKGLLNAGDYVLNKKFDNALLAANTVLASVIINSDASITKR